MSDAEAVAGADDEPVERLVYFFLPLPEPLQLPDNHRVETHDMVSFTEIRRAHREHGHSPDAWGEVLVASSRIWQTTIPRSAYLGPMLHGATEVAHRAVPTLNHKVGTAGEDDQDPDIVPQTVIEVAVRVGDFDAETAGAFELAVECVQSIQRSHYLITRRPLTLVTVENAPVVLLMAQREARPSDGPHGGWPNELGIYMPNSNVQAITPEPEWDDATVEMFGAALSTRHVGAFVPMAQLIEEGRHALHRRGDYRAAITLLYSASEVMFDTLLMLMLWEENKSPEEAISECFSEGALQTRLKGHYAPRMRGNWHFDRKGPMAAWNRDLAAVRHRIVHAGYLPAREEAYEADTTFDELHGFITERVTNPKFVRANPVTALSLMGIDGLKTYGRWTKWLERLVTDSTEIDWPATFGRWKLRLDSLRSDAEPVDIDDGDCVPVLLFSTHETDSWWLHDTVNRRVIQTEVPPDAAAKGADFFSEQRTEFIKHAQPGDRGTIAWAGDLGEPLPNAEWLPEHEVLPFHGIMRDGSDFRAHHQTHVEQVE